MSRLSAKAPGLAKARWFDRTRWFARREDGTATVEFVIAVPLVLTFLFSAIDFGAVMLRQVFLDRAVDIAVREVRLGNVTGAGYARFRERICANTFMIRDCPASLAVELWPVDIVNWSNIQRPQVCVNRAENMAPVVAFIPGAGQQELMLISVCATADPFIRLTGMVLGMPEDETGSYYIVSRAAFANEPN